MNLEECTLVELRQLAKERGIKYVSKIKKDELINYYQLKKKTQKVTKIIKIATQLNKLIIMYQSTVIMMKQIMKQQRKIKKMKKRILCKK